MTERGVYELDSATVDEMLRDDNILFFKHSSGFPYPDMADEEDYIGADIWLPNDHYPYNLNDWGAGYLGYFTLPDGVHVEAWAFKKQEYKYRALFKFANEIWTQDKKGKEMKVLIKHPLEDVVQEAALQAIHYVRSFDIKTAEGVILSNPESFVLKVLQNLDEQKEGGFQ